VVQQVSFGCCAVEKEANWREEGNDGLHTYKECSEDGSFDEVGILIPDIKSIVPEIFIELFLCVSVESSRRS
jgi:hypothetical protein